MHACMHQQLVLGGMGAGRWGVCSRCPLFSFLESYRNNRARELSESESWCDVHGAACRGLRRAARGRRRAVPGGAQSSRAS